RDVGIAVVIQRMVEATAAGVMFTRPPLASSPDGDRVINAGVGLGAPVVNGVTSPDVLRVDARGRLVASVITRKPRALVVGDRGVREIDVADPDAPALSRERIAALADLAARLERLEPVAWDLEFACDAERTWLVQARPATGKDYPEGGDAQTVWSTV